MSKEDLLTQGRYPEESFILLLEEIKGASIQKVKAGQHARVEYEKIGTLDGEYDQGKGTYEGEVVQALHHITLDESKLKEHIKEEDHEKEISYDNELQRTLW